MLSDHTILSGLIVVYTPIVLLCRSTHWNEKVISTKLLSLAAPKVVNMTTFSAVIDENFIEITPFSSVQWIYNDKTWHDDVIKWKHFQPYSSLTQVPSNEGPALLALRETGDRRIPLTKASDAEFWCFIWTNDRANNRDTGDLRRHRANCDVTVI